MSQRRSNSRGRNSRNTVVKRDRYSVEQSSVRFALTPVAVNNGAIVARSGGDIGISFPVVPYTGAQGMRKVKHLTVTCTLASPALANATNNPLPNIPITWALVYFPQPGGNLATAYAGFPGVGNQNQAVFQTLYEPNQHVISCGIAQVGSPIRISTPLARNLNSNDQIYLTMLVQNAGTYQDNLEAQQAGSGATWLQNTILTALVRYAVTYN